MLSYYAAWYCIVVRCVVLRSCAWVIRVIRIITAIRMIRMIVLCKNVSDYDV